MNYHDTMTTNGAWTADAVREELPKVLVRMPDGSMRTGQVAGRQKACASVLLDDTFSIDVAWSTIAHVLNSNGRAAVIC